MKQAPEPLSYAPQPQPRRQPWWVRLLVEVLWVLAFVTLALGLTVVYLRFFVDWDEYP